jgi:DNA-binding GntR family transcriptional regulator
MAPSDKEVVDTLRVRQVLEAWAMHEIAGRLSPEAVATARRLVDDIGRAAKPMTSSNTGRPTGPFTFLAAQVGNRRVDSIVSELYDAQRIAVRVKSAAARDLNERNRDHHALLDALAAGDGARAADILASHLERSYDPIPVWVSNRGRHIDLFAGLPGLQDLTPARRRAAHRRTRRRARRARR